MERVATVSCHESTSKESIFGGGSFYLVCKVIFSFVLGTAIQRSTKVAVEGYSKANSLRLLGWLNYQINNKLYNYETHNL